jgi:hypothetical protein
VTLRGAETVNYCVLAEVGGRKKRGRGKKGKEGKEG